VVTDELLKRFAAAVCDFDRGESHFSSIGQQQCAPITHASDGCRADIDEFAGRLSRCTARKEWKKCRRKD
jgi:hypothetical protein